MELFLNLVWLFLSLGLVSWWVRSPRADGKAGWTVAVALVMLLLLLLPAISMTDDLQAINLPAELEHMLRHELTPVTSVLTLETRAIALPAPDAASAGLEAARIEPRTFASVLRAGSVRSAGTRPPTRRGA